MKLQKTPPHERALIELAKNKDIIVLSTEPTQTFRKQHPHKQATHPDVSHLIGMAIGVALEGKTPIVITNTPPSYADIDRINHLTIAIILTTPAHIYHPSLTIVTPSTNEETEQAIIACSLLKTPSLIMPTPTTNSVHTHSFSLNHAQILSTGNDCTIITNGNCVNTTLTATQQTHYTCTILNVQTLQPLDKHAILSAAHTTGCVVIAEGTIGLRRVSELLIQHAPVPTRIIIQPTIAQIQDAIQEVILEKCKRVHTCTPEQYTHIPAKPELTFQLHGGEEIHTIKGLHHALLTMDEKTFTHHCNNQKNDFATWIEQVFNQKKLAQEIREAKTKTQMTIILTRWLT